MKVTYLEVYNNYLLDLFHGKSSKGPRGKIVNRNEGYWVNDIEQEISSSKKLFKKF